MRRFHSTNFKKLCRQLADADQELKGIITQYGYPPVWSRPNEFASLIHIILEQQVSLASAKAAFVKLKEYTGTITPESLLQLSDTELRQCYFSRQKTIYARELALAIKNGSLELDTMETKADEEVRMELKKIKGIGDWTVDIYLLFVLKRCDIFPTGDLAMMNAFREVKAVPQGTAREILIAMAEKWRPNRSIATYLLWHYYIQKKGIKI